MGRPVHFEMTVENSERARAFYSAVFGWTFAQWGGDNSPYWLATTGPGTEPGIDGVFVVRHGDMGPGTTNAISVASVEDATNAIREAGGQILLDKTPIPGMGYVAYVLDTENNHVSVFQADENAR